MEHWSKTSLFEPQPLGKHKRRERDDVAGASRGGSGKVLKLLNVYPAARKVPGAFSGGEATQPAEKPKRREREEDDAGAFHGGSGKVLELPNVYPAARKVPGAFSGGESTQPAEKPKRQEREEDDAGAFHGGSGKSQKITNVSPASRAENGGFRSSGGEVKKRLSSASRRESNNVRRDCPRGTAPNVDHRTRNVSALSPPREGSTCLVKKTGHSTSLVMKTGNSTCLVKTGEPRTEGKMEMVKDEGQRTELKQKEWMQARGTVMAILRLYRDCCKSLEKDRKKLYFGRVDLMSCNMMKSEFPRLTEKQPSIGTVAGIEVGDRFTYRAELHLAGMHRPLQCGIDTTVDADENMIAISVVDSGRYDNYMSDLETLVYCAQGSSVEKQEEKKVNLAMIKSKEVKNPVRVIRTRKVNNSTVYFYDGLYTVKDMWEDRKLDGNMLRFKLVRNPGQPSSFLKENP